MNHHPKLRRARLVALMRSREAEDRRRFHRFEEHGLMARIGDRLLEVHDVSLGGIRVKRLDLEVGSTCDITLLPREEGEQGTAESLAVRGVVAGHVDGWTRIQFPSMSYTLAKFLIQHLARSQGVEPYIFK